MLKAMFGWFIGCIIGVILSTLLGISLKPGETGVYLIVVCALAGACLGIIWNNKDGT